MTVKLQMAERARAYLEENAIIIDTETTGLDSDAEIVEIAICDARGLLEFSALVKPTKPIPPEASNVHGITDEAVALARPWPQVQNIINAICFGRTVLAYNAGFDQRMVKQSMLLCEPKIEFEPYFWGCIMEAYKAFSTDGANTRIKKDGTPYKYRQTPKLIDVAKEIGYVVDEAHRAMADAKAARAVLLHMAAYQEPQQAALLDVPIVGAGEYEAGEV